MTYRASLILVLILGQVTMARAGIFFNRKKDTANPKPRVSELISSIRGDRDADKRARAAEELRNFDPAQHPDIVPVLIQALQKDPRPAVRLEAAQTLGRIRPVSQQAGEALEHALSSDSSMRVRLQARSALLQYHWSGYRSTKKPDSPPPLATPNDGKTPPAVNTQTPSQGGFRPFQLRPTAPAATQPRGFPPANGTQEPPLAPPLPSETKEPPAAAPAPAPSSTASPLPAGPATPPSDDGPLLP